MFISACMAATAAIASANLAEFVPTVYAGKTVLNKPLHMTEKVVALTFDDGPSPYTTPRVLAALKKYKAPSTFFVVGRMIKGREKLLKQMERDGHVIANHSFSHSYRPDKAKAEEEIKKTNMEVFRVIGRYPKLYRPPGGIMDSWTARLAKSRGMPSVIWTGSSADTVVSDAGSVASHVLAAARPGAIILLHDVKEHTAQAVPSILKTLKKRGYRCVTVPQMLQIWEEANKKAQSARVAGSRNAAHKSDS